MNRKDIREDWYQYVEDNTDANNKLNFRTVVNMFDFVADILDNIENEACVNCEYSDLLETDEYACSSDYMIAEFNTYPQYPLIVDKNFKCREFKRKEK